MNVKIGISSQTIELQLFNKKFLKSQIPTLSNNWHIIESFVQSTEIFGMFKIFETFRLSDIINNITIRNVSLDIST